MGSCEACDAAAMPSSPYCGRCLEPKLSVERLRAWREDRSDGRAAP
jgi:hypothetical protein